MGSNWKTTKLLDHYDIRSGLSKPAKDFGSGHPFLTFKDVFYNYFTPDELGDLVQSNDKERENCSVKRGDVFLTRTSETMHELGMSCVALQDYENATFNGFCKRLRPHQNSELVPEYVGYYLRSPKFRQSMLAFSTMSTRASLNNEMIGRLEISYPLEEEQIEIARVLKNLDDKITLNRQINQTLEQMAQALFKSWFVDFDPVVDNALDTGFFEQDLEFPDELLRRAETRKTVRENADFKALPEKIRQLFPAAFEENSEASLGLGSWVPVGWEMCKLSDFGAVVCGKTPSKQNKSFYGNDIPFIKIPDMHGNAFITRTSDNLSFNGSESQIKKLIPKNSICVSCIATVGLVSITTKPAHTNQQINSLIPRYEYFRDYLYFSLLNKNKQFHDLASGGSTTLNMNTRVFSNVPLINPGNVVLQLFQKESGALLDRIKQSLHEIDVLTNLRDTLLPKLISGELRLSDSEVDTAEEVLA